MGDPTFVSPGENDRLAKLLRRIMPEARTISAACLEALGPLAEDPDLRILVDPRSARSCCVRKLENIARDTAVSPQNAPNRFHAQSGNRIAARQAWTMRRQLLAADQYSETVRFLIVLARAHAREQYTVQEAAMALQMTSRHLHREVVFETNCAPHIILSVARIESIVSLLSESKLRLGEIATLHQFPDQSAMTRFFKSYLGTTPGAYRNERRRKNVRNCTSNVRNCQ